MGIAHISDKNFVEDVLGARELVLVDFWAPWCAPCQMLSPILEKLTSEYNERMKIFKVNIDENQNLATMYQILSIPTLLFFKSGKIVKQIVGSRSASELKKTIDSLI